ncbi:uncharacterized protein LAESUDRAFT_722738 [Laetiporus sulphureus 93-53]|uniref:GATA-domain-containing protein n=1 Tax=Laetiporus sulphureus 93-53 TaxID=1314785 RepID=A0A165G2T5_9APHY|nr:uncharacterized protein LAESUDRAFT_722738 [Laetiporus sulphureus 93-53]KZT09753.1 hypothetical protein LAESUDRAFT_722738 [Laetiporus sulphureus 93-53]
MSLSEAMSLPTPTSAVRSSTSSSGSAGSASVGSLGSGSGSTGPSTRSSVREQAVFEFTKRKRWADLLVTELSEAILLVLSAEGKVWYCGAAVGELLGWREDDLVDADFAELMNADDRAPFRAQLQKCLQYPGQRSLLAYARLQCKNDVYATGDYASRPREVLFEIIGYAHTASGVRTKATSNGEDCQVIFAAAKPYPSRNTAMLNTFLELKMENERLQQRVLQLRAQARALDAPIPSSSPPGPSGHFAQQNEGYYGQYEEIVQGVGAKRGRFEGDAGSTVGGEDDENGSKKKLKRSFTGTEQYVCVTCGRTDSPEWRKGPMGPKTLCNACGLRWAKKVRTDRAGQLDGDGDSGGGNTGAGASAF